MQNIVVRQVLDEECKPETSGPDPVLSAMRQLSEAAINGTSMAALKPELERYTRGNRELAELMENLFLRYQTNRFTRWLEREHKLEGVLQRCMDRTDLTPAEALILLDMAHTQVAKIAEGVQQVVEDGLPEPNADAATAKLDYTVQITERETLKRFDKMTPQGREIVRKLTMRARKNMKKNGS